jgi:hypothetical protein
MYPINNYFYFSFSEDICFVLFQSGEMKQFEQLSGEINSLPCLKTHVFLLLIFHLFSAAVKFKKYSIALIKG